MLRRLAAIVTCVVFLAAVPTGSLYVTTLPAGADVWVDGTYIGRSPLVLDALTTGHHNVGLAKPGWGAQQLDVSIITGQTTLSSIRLQRDKGTFGGATGAIALHGLPYERAYLDGVEASPGRDGTLSAAPGTHELVVRTPKGKLTRTVTVWPGTRTDVVLQLDASPTRPTVVAPADDYVPVSAIRIDGEKIVIRFGGHEARGHIGSTWYRLDGKLVEYDSAPTVIGTRLYLPISLLIAVSGNDSPR
jgi:PEGA domain